MYFNEGEMEIEKTEPDQYKLTFTEREQEIVKYVIKYIHENYDQLDEALLHHTCYESAVLFGISKDISEHLILDQKKIRTFWSVANYAHFCSDYEIFDDENKKKLSDEDAESFSLIFNQIHELIYNRENK